MAGGELFIYSARDPDAVAAEIVATSEEARVVADLLGGTELTQSMLQLRQEVEGLAIDWLPLPDSSPFAGPTIGMASPLLPPCSAAERGRRRRRV